MQTRAVMKRSSLGERLCPVSRAAAQVADAWAFVILRELFLGNRRFEGLRRHSGMAPRSLALRLARLVDDGIVEKVALRDEPSAHEYRLTDKGLALWPVLLLLRQWGERWAGPWGRQGPPLQLLHRGRGHRLQAVVCCADCGEPVDTQSAEMHPTAAALRERAAFAASQDSA
jgi:DNA-binding HxlR family transcriptional regulator